MNRFHNVDGKRIPFTKLEEEMRNDEEVKAKSDRSMKIWIESMESSDETLITRELEDHIMHDHGGVTNSQVLQKSYRLKKLLREGKPES